MTQRLRFTAAASAFGSISLWLLAAVPPAAADWPQFLGPGRDLIYPGPELAASWPEGGPPVRWKRSVGAGFAGPAVASGRLILFHRRGDEEIVDCFDAESGDSRWSFRYPTAYSDDFGFDEGPRATPAVAGGKVFTFGAEGKLHALDLETGKKLWSVDTHEKFRVQKGFFGAACSPLVEGEKVLLNVGGPDGAGVAAFEWDTGAVAWTATSHEAGYSSPAAATIAGKRRALFFTREGLVGIDPATGKVDFDFHWRSRSRASVNAATPLVMGDLVFISASYGTGAALLRLGGGAPETLWSGDDVLSCHYATSVQRDGLIWGFHGRQESGPSLRCIELKTGKVRWSEEGFGAGTLLLAGAHLVILRESGELVLAAASPEKFLRIAGASILAGTVRAYPALAGGLLYARDESTLVCVDLSAPVRK